MFLTKRPGGYYALVYVLEGKRKLISTRTKSKAQALRFLKDFEAEARLEKLKLLPISLTSFIASYLVYSKGVHALNTTKTAHSVLKELMAFTGDCLLNHITPRDIDHFFAYKKETVQAYTLRKYHVTLASAFQTALRWRHLTQNPFCDVSKPKTPEKLPAFLTREQFSKLLACIDKPDFKEIVLFAVSTGLRVGEILSLHWKNIDLEKRLIHVVNSESFTTKSGKVRSIPMSDHVQEMLMLKSKSIEAECVFIRPAGAPYKPDWISRTFRKYADLAELPKEISFHNGTRATFASWLVQDGVSLLSVSKLLGHSDSQVTANYYAHLQPERMHDVVNLIIVNIE